ESSSTERCPAGNGDWPPRGRGRQRAPAQQRYCTPGFRVVFGNISFLRRGCAVRIVIVGGGVIGLLTAVRCVSAGHEVVLVDQADIPFSGAASFDRHRALLALNLDD